MMTGEPHVLSALRDRYARLAGEVAEYEARIGALRADMAQVEAVFRMFQADGDLSDTRPIKPSKGGRWFKHGECSRTVLTVLRTAEKPLTVREITERVVTACQIEGVDRDAFRRISESVVECLNSRRAGVLEAVEGSPRRWRVKPRHMDGFAERSAILSTSSGH